MTTKEELRSAFAQIDWEIEDSYNGLNDWIINDLGEQTGFLLMSDRIELIENSAAFGGDHKGNFVMYLDKMVIRIPDDKGAVYLSNSKEKNCGIVLNFYNHNKSRRNTGRKEL